MPLRIVDAGPQVVEAFFAANAVGFKRPKVIEFAHGIWSPGAYINNRTLPTYPRYWQTVLNPMFTMAENVRNDYDAIASVATGGIPHGIAIARDLMVPHYIVKKQEKDHGLGGLVDGDITLLPGLRILLVEDMSSTFESSLKAIKTLEHVKARVVHTLLLNTWDLPDFKSNVKNYSVFALCNGRMLLQAAIRLGRIDQGHQRIVSRWLEHPEDQSWAHDGKWELPKPK